MGKAEKTLGIKGLIKKAKDSRGSNGEVSWKVQRESLDRWGEQRKHWGKEDG
jgi:hypothetical protein